MPGMMLLFAACTDDDDFAQSGDLATVSFTLEASSGVETRAYSDGLTATYLMFGVYDSEDEELVSTLSQTSAVEAFSSKKATVELSLPKGSSYTIVFWAQAEDAPFDVDLENKQVKLSGETGDDGALVVKGNNESMDAFYAVVKTGTVTGSYSETVTMKRPFAQINVGSDDLTAYELVGYEVKYTKMTVTGAANTFNLFTGEVSFDDSTNGGVVIYDWAEVGDDESYPVTSSSTEEETDSDGNVISPTTKDDSYSYLAMNYVLVGAESSTVDVEFLFSATQEEEDGHSVSVSSVPVQRNYRTNLYGSLLTGTFTYNLEIGSDYTDDNSISTIQVSNADELIDALAAGYGAVTLTNDITADTYTTVVYSDATIDLGDHTLTMTGSGSRIQVQSDDVKLTVTNGTIESEQWAVVVNAEDASVTLDDAVITSSSYAVYLTSNASGSEVTITDSEIESASYAIYIYSGAEDVDLTVENSTITSTATYGRCITSSAADATITLTSDTLVSTYLGVYASGSGTTVTVKDVTIDGMGHTAYYITGDSSVVTVTGGSIENVTYYGVLTSGSGDKVTVSDVTFTDCSYMSIALIGSSTEATIDGCVITYTDETTAGTAWAITVGSSEGTTSGNNVTISNTTISVSDDFTDKLVGVDIYGYNNVITIDSCTINHNYYGITQDGTSTPGSTITVTNTTINGPYTGIYLSMSTTSEYYNTLTVSKSTIVSEQSSAIEVKKCKLTVSDTQLTTKYDGTDSSYGEGTQDYVLYGSGAGGSGYGIVLAGYVLGKEYKDDSDVSVSLTDVTYTIGSSIKAMDGNSNPWYVLYYADDDNSDGGVKTGRVVNNAVDTTSDIYSREYTDNGATSSSSFDTSTSSSAKRSTSASRRSSSTRRALPEQSLQRVVNVQI